MPTLSFRIGRTALAALGASALIALSGCGPRPRTANLTIQSADRTITVIGRADVSSKPDVARANMGVNVAGRTVGEAMKMAETKMTSLMDALKKLGIAEKDIRTSNFSINYERQYPEPMPMPEAAMAPAPAPAPAAPKGGKGAASASAASQPIVAPVAPPPPPPASGQYHVSNMVEVVIRDLSRVSHVLDTAVAAGANNIWGISFSIDETSAVEGKARELASADAKKRAETIARLSGVTLGPVVSVSEVVGGGGMPGPMPVALAAGMDRGGTPVSPGEVTFTTQLEVVYSIVSPAAPEDAESDD